MRYKKGQTASEYVMLTVVILGALVATQMYIKRAIQGRWKSTMESIGEQYDPTVMLSNIRQSLSGNSYSVIYFKPNPDDSTNRTWLTDRYDFSDTTENKTGHSTVSLY